jgi:hypothetical protein
MISDVLSDAIQKIKDYQKEMPEIYGDPAISKKIEDIKLKMRATQNWLDIPPSRK